MLMIDGVCGEGGGWRHMRISRGVPNYKFFSINLQESSQNILNSEQYIQKKIP